MGLDGLESYIAALTDEGLVYFYPNRGNAGDSVIACATYRLFDRLGVAYTTIEDWRNFSSSDKLIVYGGGGNLVDAYKDARQFIELHHRHAKRLVVFPHSVHGHEDLLRDLGGNVEILCREAVSFEYLRSEAPHVKSRLFYDLAFTLSVDSILHDRLDIPSGSLRKRWWRDVRKDWRWRLQTPEQFRRGVLNAFRTDNEKQIERVPMSNFDVSKKFAFDSFGVLAVNYVTKRFFQFINRFSLVRTDRLHVCIAAALLGKEVEFYANRYHKCEAVWEHSFKSRFDNVIWKGSVFDDL